MFTILQALDLYAFPFDPLWFFKNSLSAHKANVRGGEVVDAPVAPLIIVVIHEWFYLRFQYFGKNSYSAGCCFSVLDVTVWSNLECAEDMAHP